jgi:thiosulfate dehydrogenase [quinone] large subunit
MPSKSYSWRKDVSRAHALLRFTLGLNICLHGIVRWIAGSGNFAQSLVTMFQKTPLPVWSVYGFGLALPTVEAFIGAAVAIGFRTRVALFAGTVLMLALVFGTTLRQDWATAGFSSTTPAFTAFCSPGYSLITMVRTAFFIAAHKIL